MRNNGRPSLRITNFSDRELLALIKDVQDTEGWANSQSIAERIWPRAAKNEDFARSARTSVNQRLGWLRREGGLVEKNDKEKFAWRLTELGERFLTGRLTGGTDKRIMGLGEADLLAAMSVVGQRYSEVSYEAAWLVRREWQFRVATSK
jgi:hypothetical protein